MILPPLSTHFESQLLEWVVGLHNRSMGQLGSRKTSVEEFFFWREENQEEADKRNHFTRTTQKTLRASRHHKNTDIQI